MKYILLLFLFISSTVLAQDPDTSSALFTMREAELNFARQSVMFGRNAAFLNNFADESVIFTDKWLTNAREFWKNLKDAPVVLKWEPEFMDISASRDFGISTGPWERQEFRPNTAPLSTGYFLTVWKKQSDGNWKVMLDAGSGTPPITGTRHSFSFPSGDDKSITATSEYDVELSGKELIDRDNLFSMEWKKNQASTVLTSFFEPDIRMQRNGHIPTTNPDSIRIWMGQLDRTLTWIPIGSGAAVSGDLGYTYGMLQDSGNQAINKDHYIRIWRRDPGKAWKISIEMINRE